MSDTLTEIAPEGDVAVSDSVESLDAPTTPEAVVEASGPGEKVIPVERFNGLMSKFNQTQEALSQERARAEALEELIRTQEAQRTPEPEADVAEIAELQEHVSVLSDMLMEERLESAKAKVEKDYPEAVPFLDLIQTTDARQYKAMAKELAERVRAASAPASEQEATQEPAVPAAEVAPVNPDVPVSGGGSGFISESQTLSVEERIADAIARKDFQALLRAKEEQAASPLVLG